jgi:hypothetical protein
MNMTNTARIHAYGQEGRVEEGLRHERPRLDFLMLMKNEIMN